MADQCRKSFVATVLWIDAADGSCEGAARFLLSYFFDMKDIVENRQRVSLTEKTRLALLILKENGFVWCSAFAIYYLASSVSQRAFSVMDRLRREKGVPGMNSRALNKAIWEAWDWSAGGEEWSPSEEWKESLIRSVLDRHMPKDETILEIGPGGGRWTGQLIDRASSFTAVDISESCVRVCREKFADRSNASFMVGSGSDLSGISSESMDAIWSFDVFVHINAKEVERYVEEFERVLKPGGVGVIHHGSVGGALGGWRSDMTQERMLAFLKGAGFEIVDSFKEWKEDGKSHLAGLYEDVITVFRRPVA